MNNKKAKNLFTIFFVNIFVLLISCLCININTYAATEEDLKIEYASVSLENSVRVNFKVLSTEGYDESNIKLLLWEGYPSTNEFDINTEGAVILSPDEVQTIDGNEYVVFQYDGISAKEFGKIMYVRAYVQSNDQYEYGNTIKYSVAQYIRSQLSNQDITEEYQSLLHSMLQYGADSQTYFDEVNGEDNGVLVTEQLYTINVVNGTLIDGFTTGKYLNTESFTLVTEGRSNQSFMGWRNSSNVVVSSQLTATVSASADNTYTAIFDNPYTEGLQFTYTNNAFKISGYNGVDTNITMPYRFNDFVYANKYVNEIGEGAFENSHIESITFRDQIKTISDNAFKGCNNLNYVSLTDKIQYIGTGAFDTGTSIVIDFNGSTEAWNNITGGRDLFGDTDYTVNINGYSSGLTFELNEFGTGYKVTGFTGSDINVEIPEKYNGLPVTELTAGIFGSATTVRIPSGVVEIPDSMFNRCENLVAVYFNEGSQLQSIGSYSFGNCANLEEVILPDSVTTISSRAFYDSSKLTRFELPQNLSVVGTYAFYNCDGLTEFNFPSSTTSVAFDAFLSISNTITINYDGTREKWNRILTDELHQSNVVEYNFYGHSDGFEYTENEDGYTLSGYTGLDLNVVMANEYNGKPITEIKDGLFADSNITSFVIGENVIRIGDNAFKNSLFTSINIPDSVESIGVSAFEGSSSLTEINISANSNLITIGADAFKGTKISSILIPANVLELVDSLFENLSTLTSITFANNSNLTTIGANVFKGTNLSSICIPASVQQLGDSLFENLNTLISVTFENGSELTTIGTNVFKGTSIYEICIPANVNELGDSMFENISTLFSVTFENGSELTTIGTNVFRGTSITEITLPLSLVSIGANTFEGLDIKSIAIPAGVTVIPSGLFKNCQLLQNVMLNVNITTIGEEAFYNCISLVKINLPVNLVIIGESAFENAGITSITIPANVTNIPNRAFKGCEELTELLFADSSTLLTMGGEAFMNCSLIEELPYFANLASIGVNAFANCSNVTEFILPETITKILYTIITGTTNLTLTIHNDVTEIADDSLETGTNLTVEYGGTKDKWGRISNSPFGTTNATVNYNGFSDGLPFVKVEGQDHYILSSDPEVSYTGEDANVVIPDYYNGLPVVGSITFNVFYQQQHIKSVRIPESIIHLGESAFDTCGSLKEINVDHIVSFGPLAFARTGLESFVIPSGVTTLPEYLFFSSRSLASIVIHENVTSIGKAALCTSSNHLSVYFEGTGEQGGSLFTSNAFAGFSQRTIYYTKDFVLTPNDVENFEYYLFTSYTGNDGSFNVPNEYLGKSIRVIKSNAFNTCENLSVITVPNTVTTIEANAFASCPSLIQIIIPSSVTSIGENAFNTGADVIVKFEGTEEQWLALVGDTVLSSNVVTMLYNE